ncbi:protein induced by osmotic stress [Scheffersomyces stipitis CBS 6054]|uniref:Protein induced by osmotic stress n=1 Tax=Scheffersomyces stipitis (strain ATCC 58785 / CBS 6054 / NBRC 10063 / NRRL Y-11545) TaxID=322104 RepID=A3LWG4_PICST|nr:protein induced by osmotic stress [Scheffersomyces stipitis CBS 6054]ABN66969.1 protein induced by osmotic stress [Scheffersomyces stipitis CBS 6054]5GMO_A Chain A, Protein induced by osmotic stress [Scheffersomyces stipitis CBS 6054]5YW4_A Chain A, Protein induced by osmotic stress [Scheffersomyces stipitis CBS 6054]
MTTSVFVSGATGYLAQQIIALVLSKGYKVVGSVRSEEKGANLKKLYGDDFSYEVVKVLEQKGAFDEALKKHPEVTIFLHTASPVTFEVEDTEKEILIPAINGTKYVLQSIKDVAPQITRVVYTSSVVAMSVPEELGSPDVVLSEASWSSLSYEQSKTHGVLAYFGSKQFAERAAWEFVEQEKPNFALSTVNPVYIFGPQAKDEEVKGTLNLSAEMVNSVLKLNKDDDVPATTGTFIDVRDVAKAHLAAFEKDEAKGERLLLSNTRFNGQTLLDVVRKNFPQLADKLPVGKPHSDDFSAFKEWNDKKTKKILGFEYFDFETSVVDSIKQVLKVQG